MAGRFCEELGLSEDDDHDDNDVEDEKPQSPRMSRSGSKGMTADPLGGSRDMYESSMRMATDMSDDDRRNRRRTRRRKIRARRGAFQMLPVYCSNDLVHGSWWFVLGSAFAPLIPIVPLVDLFYPFWAATPRLPILSDAATFGLLIASGFFFTIGSLAFVRATEEPPLQPLFAMVSVHVETDELLAAWLFLVATIPYPIFIAVYIHFNPHVLFYWGVLFASLLLLMATYFFVLTCYPSNELKNVQFAPQLSRALFGEESWIHKHLSNDWLASTWIFFYATLLMQLGSLGMLVLMILDGGTKLEIFDWAASTIDAFFFLMGSAYFVAGSYPRYENDPTRGLEEKPLLVKG